MKELKHLRVWIIPHDGPTLMRPAGGVEVEQPATAPEEVERYARARLASDIYGAGWRVIAYELEGGLWIIDAESVEGQGLTFGVFVVEAAIGAARKDAAAPITPGDKLGRVAAKHSLARRR